MELGEQMLGERGGGIFEPVEVERLVARAPSRPTSAKLSVSSAWLGPVDVERPVVVGAERHDQLVGAGVGGASSLRRFEAVARRRYLVGESRPALDLLVAARFEQRVLGQLLGDKASSSRLLSCSSLIAWVSWGVSTSDWRLADARGAGRDPWLDSATARSSRRGRGGGPPGRRPTPRACPGTAPGHRR